MPSLPGGKSRRISVLPSHLDGRPALIIHDGDRKIVCGHVSIDGPSELIQEPTDGRRWHAFIQTSSPLSFSPSP